MVRNLIINTKQVDFCFLQLASSIIKPNNSALYLHLEHLTSCWIAALLDLNPEYKRSTRE